ncbi:MAG: hypothetical protein BCS36_12575 [Desulfovibrio sp. MES5]|uniref:FRG domain-containing protein n=1 Tax=Desulfovibrio sp. MES5 TaxID=1899016 RepID=UPI000B9CADDF|nr:FRG domain-containing protein [Desulfovibrio sp. MES5]OXS29284.1 MAG: hypothetical protein BCS36_12575 [Desulfovibrio sp. MES5]
MSILDWENWVAIDWESGCKIGEKVVVDIKTPQALVQAIGYAKRALAAKYLVYFRGQTSYYCKMIPNLFRGASGVKESKKDLWLRRKVMNTKTFVNSLIVDDKFMRGVNKHAVEGVLQHYGVPTRFLDLVDNIWVALWFATHKRHQADGINLEQYRLSKDEYSYVYIMRFEEIEKEIDRGIYRTKDLFEVIDLRIAVDSGFLRPHAQHGIVARRIGDPAKENIDMFENVEVALRIKTSDAVAWLGNSILADVSFMFPSPFFDIGYRTLRNKISISPGIGAIDTIW